MQDGQMFTWETLGTISGASLAVFFIVQYTKQVWAKYLKFISTDMYAVIIAFFVLLAAKAYQGEDITDWRTYLLAFFNSFIVSSTAGHVYTKTKNPPVTRNQKSKNDETTTPVEVSTDETTSTP